MNYRNVFCWSGGQLVDLLVDRYITMAEKCELERNFLMTYYLITDSVYIFASYVYLCIYIFVFVDCRVMWTVFSER